jgi:hypothetical protein
MSLVAQRAHHKLGLGRAVTKDFDPPFVAFTAGNQNAAFG